MPRPHNFTPKIKQAAYARAKGHCERCTAPLSPGHFRYDHDIPVELGGASTIDNCVVACDACDHTKTYQHDIPAIAKSRHVRGKFIGATVSRRPMPGGKNDPRKRTMSGVVANRATGEPWR